ncbi:MAG: hypothetical protein ABSB78_01835 [Bacteroidota bacterium]
MKKMLLLTFLFIFIIRITYAQSVERYSSNPIPRLNVVALALAENMATAKKNVEENFRGNMKMEMKYPILVDSTYKKLKEQKTFDISFFGKSTSGKKFYSYADSVLALNANLFNIIVVDRQKKVRAISQALMVDIEQFCHLIEELLLNLDGKEIIDIAVEKGWSTDLAKENYDKKPKALINLGPSDEDRWYTYLGKKIPDLKLKTLDGADTTLYGAVNGKVTVLFVFAASVEPDVLQNIAGTAMTAKLMDNLYHGFGLGEVEPGSEFVKNAATDSTELIRK